MKANEIKKALSERHTQDFFGVEIPCGQGGSQRFDAYAIKRSWANKKYTGYEIKVSRGDFLQDDKFRGYLPFCNEFWFVCPKDMIKKEEVPEGCGLIYVYPDTFAMRKIVRPKFRDIKDPVEILLHVIFWKTASQEYPFFNSKREYFKTWLENKKFDYLLGRQVSKYMTEQISKTEGIIAENEKLKIKLQVYEEIKTILKDKGFSAFAEQNFPDRLREALSYSIPKQAKANIESILRCATALSESFIK